MDTPLDELYLRWLYSKIAPSRTKNPSRTYWKLAKQLFTKEFVWIVPNDDNRAEDGRLLREEFFAECAIEFVDIEWDAMSCSVLEMLVGLSRRLSFEANGEPDVWFWHMIKNIGLDKHNDRVKFSYENVDEILNRIIWRTYMPDGAGGLFPLRTPKEDQRKVEIWYQLSSYLLEHC